MQIGIKKIGEREGKERFVLYNRKTGDQIIKKDVSEPTMRKWLEGRKFPSELVDRCFELAREKYNQSEAPQPQAEAEDSDEMDLDFFLAELEDEDG